MDFAAEFPKASYEEWLKRVEATLRGADFDATLISQTYDGLPIAPLYTPQRDPVQPDWPGAAPFTRGSRPVPGTPLPWAVAQAHAHPDPAEANRAILDDLANGASAVVLKIADGTAGLPVTARDDFARAFDGVDLARTPIHLDAGARAAEIAALLETLWADQVVAPADRAGSFGIDPLGTLARTGRLEGGLETHLDALCVSLRELDAPDIPAQIATVDTRAYHGAGASEAQELAVALATLVAYLRAMEDAGLELDAAAGRIRLLLVADADIFATIAKLRAARLLWTRVLEASGISARPVALAAETASRMLTRYDPWVNMLRATAASFAAGVGGAEAITVAPHTAAQGLPDGFARRIARNIQLILREESHIGRVADPAGGSWYVERLTAAFAEKAWALFQEIESAGGMADALLAGGIQGMIAETRAARERDIARCDTPITGVSTFPDIDEEPPAAPAPQEAATATSLAETECEPLPAWRLAEAFERLRDAATGHSPRPQIFLANLGRLADFSARASWARNFFEAGGIRAIPNDGHPDPQAAAEAFRASGAAIAVICSSDALYADHAAATADALKSAGAKRVYLVGQPFAADHIDVFIHEGCDVLATLQDAHEALGIAAVPRC